MSGCTTPSFSTRLQRSLTLPVASTPEEFDSPSPIAACRSPIVSSAPLTNTRRKMLLTAARCLLSRLPPCGPGMPVGTGAPAGVVAIFPTWGLAGMLIVSENRMLQSSISTILWWALRILRAKPPLPGAYDALFVSQFDTKNVDSQCVARLSAVDEDGSGNGINTGEGIFERLSQLSWFLHFGDAIVGFDCKRLIRSYDGARLVVCVVRRHQVICCDGFHFAK